MRVIAALVLCLLALPTLAAPATVGNGRLLEYADRTQLVFDLSGPVAFSSFVLDDPDRVVVDIPNAHGGSGLRAPNLRSAQVRTVRSGIRRGRDLRLVLDLTRAARHQVFVLPPDERDGHRLVVDVFADRPNQVRAENRPRYVQVSRDIVVAVDAGHGGRDPGAVGPKGTHEKSITLSVARKLAGLIDAEPGMKAILTRDSDRYVGLRRRIEIANRQNADLFVSIHADASPRSSARGASVYVLSRGRASSEAARMLADRENAADLRGSFKLLEDEEIDRVVLDMQQDANLEASVFLAKQVLDQLDKLGPLFKRRVEHASFAVLTSPVMPSILVETAFISNPKEERRLRSRKQQQALADSIMSGIRAYFRKRPAQDLMIVQTPVDEDAEPLMPVTTDAPPKTAATPVAQVRRTVAVPAVAESAVLQTPPIQLISRPRVPSSGSMPARPLVHRVRRGESLADIARRYGIPLNLLRSANDLPQNQLRVPAATVLTVPLLTAGGN